MNRFLLPVAMREIPGQSGPSNLSWQSVQVKEKFGFRNYGESERKPLRYISHKQSQLRTNY